jgi:hypothetical protein
MWVGSSQLVPGLAEVKMVTKSMQTSMSPGEMQSENDGEKASYEWEALCGHFTCEMLVPQPGVINVPSQEKHKGTRVI